MWVNDRFDEGRRVVEHGLKDGRKLIDHGVRDGRRALGHGFDDGRRVLNDRFDDGRRLVRARFDDSRKAVNVGVGLSSPLWPTFLAAAGAGVAFWWWTQWSRGKAEAEARAAAGRPQGAAGQDGGSDSIDRPEMVMAHHVPPPGGPVEVEDKADAALVEPAEQLMMHAPVDETPVTPAPKRARALKGNDALATTTPKAKAAARKPAAGGIAAPASAASNVEERLGVQGAAAAPKAGRRSAPKPTNGVKPPPRPRKGGPTVM